MLDAALPAFHRPTLQGGTFDSSVASGQVLVIDFFAAYCRPCQRKLPALEALHRRQPQLAIVGVSLDETGDAARKSVTRHHLTFPVVHDAGNVLAGRLRVTELPISFVVDGQGRILDGQPTGLHQRVSVMLGSRAEIERLEGLHARALQPA